MPTALVVFVVVLAACAAPATSPSPVATFASRSPSPSPTVDASEAPSATETSSPSPTASADLSPFTVAPNPEVDALFLDRDGCENVADGYRLQFPDAWYTNTAIGEVEPCSWFSPTFYSVPDPSEVPPEIAITIEYLQGDRGSFEEAVSREFGIVGATQPAVRVEYQGALGDGGQMPPDWREYVYVVQLGPTAEEGPNLLIRTSTDMGGDYDLNKAVLDRIVATMELIGTVQ
jgi:hypothetical protein